MESISVGEIVKWSSGELISGDAEGIVTSVCVDSRQVQPGSLFVPIRGERVDGHDFIEEAFRRGAGASLLDSSYKGSKVCEGTLISVDDTVKALQDIAKNYRKRFDIPVIGVTGSVGKSTTKEMTAAVLGSELDVLKTTGNYNGQIGLPLTLLNLESHHGAAVVEMGISKFGEMDRLADIACANIGIVTNIGVSHLENLKTSENICAEKLKLLKDYKGKYYLNGDSPLLAGAANLEDVTYFGLNGSYKYSAQGIYFGSDSTEFVLVAPDFKDDITIPCLGMHNVYNALAAIAVALDMGIHLDDIKLGLLGYKGLSMRQQILNIQGLNIIDDSYNASPDSVKSSVSVMRALPIKGKNIVVMSDMLELGERSEQIHYELGKYMAVEGIDVLITVGNLSKFIQRGADDSPIYIKTVHCKDNGDAFKEVMTFAEPGDKILVKGSRGMHTEEIVSMLRDALSEDRPQN